MKYWLKLTAALAIACVVGNLSPQIFHDFLQSNSALFSSTGFQRSSAKKADNITARLEFAEKYCNLTDVNWFPGAGHWQERAPAFFLAGNKKCGTTSLADRLNRHPLIAPARTKELLFFLPNQFDEERFVDDDGKTIVSAVRESMWYEDRHSSSDKTVFDYPKKKLQRNASLVSFEATPGYFLYTNDQMRHLLCTCPWAKILVILREPVDRVWSHFNFLNTVRKRRGRRPLPSFDQFVQTDIDRLKHYKVIRNFTSEREFEAFSNSPAERKAWIKYLEYAWDGYEAQVARGLYALQLQHWYDAMREMGRDPEQDIFLVRTEDLKAKPDTTLNRIYRWLGLPEIPPKPGLKDRMVSDYDKPFMSPETQRLLEEFYAQHNRRFYNMLGGDWVGIWDKKEQADADVSGKLYEGAKVAKNGEMTKRESTEDEESDEVETESASSFGRPDYDEEKGEAFTEEWCEMQGAQWFPEGENAWKLRAPYFLLPGAKKSGTTSLASYLSQHPRVLKARTKELHFFNNGFDDHETDDHVSLVKSARRFMYTNDYDGQMLSKDLELVSFDATPGYLFISAKVPRRVMCVCPWVKLVVILRDPVDRAYSNYAFHVRTGGLKTDFETYVRQDLSAMKRAGFIHDDPKKQKEFMGSTQEDEAWERYLELMHEGPVGRGVYEIQLRHWFQAFRDIGRDPTTQIHILRTEDMERDVHGEYKKILEFLGLPPHKLNNVDVKVKSKYSSPMRPQTRRKLEKFYAPYTARLYDMLGGDWAGYWDQNKTKS